MFVLCREHAAPTLAAPQTPHLPRPRDPVSRSAGPKQETRITGSESESESCGSPGPLTRTGKFPAGQIGTLTGEPESGASGSASGLSPPEYWATGVTATSMLCCVPTCLGVRTIQNPRFRAGRCGISRHPGTPASSSPFVRREQNPESGHGPWAGAAGWAFPVSASERPTLARAEPESANTRQAELMAVARRGDREQTVRACDCRGLEYSRYLPAHAHPPALRAS